MNNGSAPGHGLVMSLIAARDEGALTLLEELYGKLIKKIAVGIVGSDEDAMEVKNDTLFEVWNSIPPAKPDNLRAYVAAVCRRKAVDTIKHREAKKRNGSAAESFWELEETVEGFEERTVDSMVIRDILNGFLASLSERDRQIFMKRYWLFQPTGRIASSLGVSAELVKSSLFRMRNKLRKELERGLK